MSFRDEEIIEHVIGWLNTRWMCRAGHLESRASDKISAAKIVLGLCLNQRFRAKIGSNRTTCNTLRAYIYAQALLINGKNTGKLRILRAEYSQSYEIN